MSEPSVMQICYPPLIMFVALATNYQCMYVYCRRHSTPAPRLDQLLSYKRWQYSFTNASTMTVCWASGTTLVVCWRIVHSGVTVGFVTRGGADKYYCDIVCVCVCGWLNCVLFFCFSFFNPSHSFCGAEELTLGRIAKNWTKPIWGLSVWKECENWPNLGREWWCASWLCLIIVMATRARSSLVAQPTCRFEVLLQYCTSIVNYMLPESWTYHNIPTKKKHRCSLVYIYYILRIREWEHQNSLCIDIWR